MLFLERQRTWIYLVLGVIGFIYLRAGIDAYLRVTRAMFRLERETAQRTLVRAGVMTAGVAVCALVVFVLTNFINPALPASARPTPLPTVSLLASPEAVLDAQGALVTVTVPAEAGDELAACLNPDATISSPTDGEQLRGVVDILGAANIANFAFYKIEYRSVSSEGTWRAIMAGTEPVCETFCEIEDSLGTWDTSLVPAADYLLRLVVTDTSGNAPQPCQIRVSVVP